jgi:DNA-binding NtrC family response regulator
MLATGRFRKDLFYRLNVVSLHIPRLRERPEDITAITQHFLSQTAKETGLRSLSIDKEAERALRQGEWPGNVRELMNVLERSVHGLDGETIRLTDLPFYVQRGDRTAARRRLTSLRETQTRSERETIWSALKEAGFSKVRAAETLGIHRTLLYKKMKKYNLPLHPPQ